MKIAIAQLNPTVGDLAANAEQILATARQAAAADAQLLLTPELALCGYPPRDLLLNPGFVMATVQQLTQLARDLPPSLVALVGTVEANPNADARGEKPLFNSIAQLADGRVQQYFRKRLLPTYDVFDEDRYFEPGDRSNCFQLAVNAVAMTIGVTVCEDLWNDEEFWGKRSYEVNPLADLAAAGADLIVNLSASPYSVGKQRLREAMLSHAARRFQQPIIYVNQVGGNDDLLFDGSSVACNRAGEVVSRAAHCQPALTLV
ncbi:MAG: NAD+ synthase, partial [Spirulinaceae cyanobacterium RM2_2_10]|nr:NAD+ synthase [Spirulinaceae cyanobacterium RM2_2_10]